MEKFTKIIVTVVIVIAFILSWTLVVFLMESTGRGTPGILGMAVMCVFIAALRAIWKKPKDNDDNHPAKN